MALKGLTLELAEHEVVGLIGLNGAGKEKPFCGCPLKAPSIKRLYNLQSESPAPALKHRAARSHLYSAFTTWKKERDKNGGR